MLSPFFSCQAQSLFMKRSSVFQSVFVLRKPLSKKQERSFTRSATSLDMEKFSLASKYKGIFIFDSPVVIGDAVAAVQHQKFDLLYGLAAVQHQ